MSLRGALSLVWPRVRAHPELLLIGGAISILHAASLLAVRVALTAVPAGNTGLLTVVSSSVAFLLALPLFVGVYELALDPAPAEEFETSIRRATTRTKKTYAAVLRTDFAVSIVAGVIGLGIAIAWFVIETGARFAGYVVVDAGPPHSMESVSLLVAAWLLGSLTASFFLRFADVLTAFRGYSPRAAIATTAATTWNHIPSVIGLMVLLGGVQLLSLFTGVVAGELASSDSWAGGPVLWLGGSVVLSSVAVAFVGTVHALFFDELALPDGGRPRSLRGVVPSAPRPHWVVACVLVVGLVTGAAAIRTLDVGATAAGETGTIETDDPDAAIAAAAEATRYASHRAELYVRNMSQPNATERVSISTGVDFEDRQSYVYFAPREDDRFGGFYGEGTLAMYESGGSVTGIGGYEVGDWVVMAVPAWGLTGDDVSTWILPDGPESGWSVVESNSSHLVVRVTDDASIESAFGPETYAGLEPPLAEDSHVTAYIDRERGVLEETRFRLHSNASGDDFKYRLVYSEVGTADLERPGPIRRKHVLERAWDVLYY